MTIWMGTVHTIPASGTSSALTSRRRTRAAQGRPRARSRSIAPHRDVTEEPHRLGLAAMVLGLAGPRRARLPRDPEEVRRRPAENLAPILVAKPGNRQDVVDGGGVPRERVIGPEDHMLDP